MKKDKKIINFVLVLVMILQAFTPLMEEVAYASKVGVIDEVIVEEGSPLNGKTSYNVKGTWSIEDKSKKGGDRFKLELPREFQFNTPQNTLYLNSPDGRVYAEGTLDRKANVIEFVFTDLVEKEFNIYGRFYINGLTSKTESSKEGIVDRNVQIKEDGREIWQGSIKVDTGSIENIGSSDYYNFNFRKNPQKGSQGYSIEYKDGYMYLTWNIDINTTEKDQYRGNLVIEDLVDASQIIDKDSFELTYLQIYNKEAIKGVENIRKLNRHGERVNGLEFIDGDKGFRLDMDLDGSKGYILWYKTKVSLEDFLKDADQGLKAYTNTANLQVNGENLESSSGQYEFAAMGGTGTGQLPKNEKTGNLRLIKVDENGNILDGAKFRIEKYTSYNETQLIREVEIGDYTELRDSGSYKITEIEAPNGYKKLDQPIVVSLDFKKLETISILESVIKKLRDSDQATVNYNIYLEVYDLDSNLGNSINNRDRKWAIEQLENRVNGLKSTLNVGKDNVFEIEYDLKTQSYLLKIQNKGNKKDLEIVKRWDIPEEDRDRLAETIEAKFNIEAYKLVDNRPTKLVAGELEDILGKSYSIAYNKDSLESNLVIKDLPYSDDNGSPYVYTIKEESLEDFEETESQTVKLVDFSNKEKASLEFINKYASKPKGSFELKKVDSEDQKVLKGAKFTLTKDGQLVYEGVTDEYGILKFGNLSQGEYQLKETEAPDGYKLDENPMKIEVKEDGQVHINEKELNDGFVTITNTKEEKATGSFTLKKVDSKDSNVTLAGAEFTLFNGQELVSKGVTGENGILKFENLSQGKYQLKETKSPDGYKLSNEVIEIVVDKDGKVEVEEFEEKEDSLIEKVKSFVTELLAGEKELIIEFPNEEEKIDIKVIKKDSKDGKFLPGAKFTLRSNDGEDKFKNISSLTDENGEIEFKALSKGKYTLEEVEAPKGYILDKRPIEIEIRETLDGLRVFKGEEELKDNILVVENKKIDKPVWPERKINLSLKKVDSKDKNLTLEGVKFSIKDESGKELSRGSTGSDGVLRILNLKVGKYIIEEKETLKGYTLDKRPIEIEVRETLDGLRVFKGEEELKDNILVVENKKIDKPVWPERKINLSLKKVDSKDKNLTLEGVKFSIKDESGKELSIGSTGSDGVLRILNLKVGKYIIEEEETLKGYILDKKPIEIEVRETLDGLRVFKGEEELKDNILVVENKKIDEPVEPVDPNPTEPAEKNKFTLVINKIASDTKKAIEGVLFELERIFGGEGQESNEETLNENSETSLDKSEVDETSRVLTEDEKETLEAGLEDKSIDLEAQIEENNQKIREIKEEISELEETKEDKILELEKNKAEIPENTREDSLDKLDLVEKIEVLEEEIEEFEAGNEVAKEILQNTDENSQASRELKTSISETEYEIEKLRSEIQKLEDSNKNLRELKEDKKKETLAKSEKIDSEKEMKIIKLKEDLERLKEENKYLEEKITDGDGQISFENLEAGTYILREKKAAEGFKNNLQGKGIRLEITESGDVRVLEGANLIEEVKNNVLVIENPRASEEVENPNKPVGSKSGKPEKPTDPKPVEPEEPKLPESPENPTEPTNPIEPIEPEKPTEPTDTKPEIPKLVEPEKPEKPTVPEDQVVERPEEPRDPKPVDFEDPKFPDLEEVVIGEGEISSKEDDNHIYGDSANKDDNAVDGDDHGNEDSSTKGDSKERYSEKDSNSPMLPKTGEAGKILFVILGLLMIALGIKVNKKQA